MKNHPVTLRTSKKLFRGFASQNMLFHQCIGELVDNAIAGTEDGKKFRIDIVFNRPDKSDIVDVWVADNAAGMNLEGMKRALQPAPDKNTPSNRLNEHGLGLKNSLATLCPAPNDEWDIWSHPCGDDGIVYHVKGPFAEKMNIEELKEFPKNPLLPKHISTLIRAKVPMAFIQTVQGRGQQKSKLEELRPWFEEHIGVHYRGYLEEDKETGKPSGGIYVKIKNDGRKSPTPVKPISVPIVHLNQARFEVELDNETYEMEYNYGGLDDVQSQKHYSYYRGNEQTQGIDIRLGKRVITTSQMETIWKLKRDNHFNKFVGELLIPDLRPGLLKTKSDKTDFNLNDPAWGKIFFHLREEKEYYPIRDADPAPSDTAEAKIRDKWKDMLEKAKDPGDIIGKEIKLWPTGTRLDLYKETKQGDITIYELKIGAGKPLDLYQLKMYWDGLVLMGKTPRRAVLLANSFSDSMKAMAKMMGERLRAPENKTTGGKAIPYRFDLETLGSKELMVFDSKKKRKKQ